jgi:hypothetical protein
METKSILTCAADKVMIMMKNQGNLPLSLQNTSGGLYWKLDRQSINKDLTF